MSDGKFMDIVRRQGSTLKRRNISSNHKKRNQMQIQELEKQQQLDQKAFGIF
jgi:hypothetical protein